MIGKLGGWLVFRGNRAFTALWYSETVSLFGSQVTFIAIPLLAALTLNAGAFEMGLIAAVETLPYLLFSLPAGVLADRIDRRRLLIVANLARAALVLAIPMSVAFGALSLPLLYLLSFLIGTFSVVFDVAYQTFVPDLLETDELLAGNQRIELSESAARTVGPGLGGALVAVAGSSALIIDAFSYLMSAFGLLFARRKPPPVVDADDGIDGQPVRPDAIEGANASIGHLVDMWEYVAAIEARLARLEAAAVARKDRWGMRAAFAGLGIVGRDRILRDMAASTATFNLASAAISAVFVLYAATEIGMDATSIGILLAAGNVGFVIGAVAVGAATRRFGVGPMLVASSVLGAIATIILPFAAGAAAVGFLFAGRFLGAFTIPFYNVNALVLRQSRAPREALGRVNAVFRMLDWGALPVGALLGGSVGSVFGLRATLAMGAILGVASAGWLIWSPLRRIRDLKDQDAVEEAVEADLVELIPPTPTLLPRRPSFVGAAGSSGWRFSFVGRVPHIEWAPVAIVAALAQGLVFFPPVNALVGGAPPFIYVLSSAAVLAVVVRNRRIPGLMIAAIGGLSNLLAVVANGGYMPVNPDAARAVGHLPATGYTNTVELANAYLAPLTDIIVVPPPLPFANVYSVGDLLIALGVAIAVAWTLQGPPSDESRQRPRPPGNESTPLAGTGLA
jgi:MFS family permease